MKSLLEVRTWGGRRQIPSFETDWQPRGRPCANQHQAMAVALKTSTKLMSSNHSAGFYPTILLGAIQPFYSIQPLWTLENPHLVPLLRLQISVRSSPSSCLVHQNNGEIHSAQQQQRRPERIDETFLQSTSASQVHPCIRPWCIISLSTREVVARPRWDAFLVCYNSAEMHYASQVLLC